MDAQIKSKWIAALRSGTYDQCIGALSEEGKFCCLGVLAVVEGVEVAELDDVHDTSHTAINAHLNNSQRNYLARLNDEEGQAFPEIADYIEANL